jgi:nitronate monooxygenase
MANQSKPFSREEQVAFLNQMLEAERAGAKALLAILEQSPRRGEAWAALRRVHSDEAHNCALLGKQLERLGADYSHATGDFLGKLLAVEGVPARVEFLGKGLRWAVKRLDQAMPRLDEDARATFARIRESHLRSIEVCGSVVGMLNERGEN